MSLRDDSKKSLAPLDTVSALVKILEQSGLTEIDYACGNVRVRVLKGVPPSAAGAAVPLTTTIQSAALPELEKAKSFQGHSVTSPLVGTAYISPKPGADPFVKVGDTVQEGQVLFIIEAMKIMNPIKSPVSGTLVAMLVDNATPVEYGEELARIE